MSAGVDLDKTRIGRRADTSPAVMALAIASLLGAAVAPFVSALGIPYAVSGVVSAVGFAAVWAVLKNLRELNAALNDEYEGPESG